MLKILTNDRHYSTSRSLERIAVTTLLVANLMPTITGYWASKAVSNNGSWFLGWNGVVRQSRESSCGLAVLATLLQWQGTETSEGELIEEAQLGESGISLAEFKRVANRNGILGQWRRVRSRHIPELSVPVVLHLASANESGHYVILVGRHNEFLLIADPAQGYLLLRRSMLETDWTGYIFANFD